MSDSYLPPSDPADPSVGRRGRREHALGDDTPMAPSGPKGARTRRERRQGAPSGAKTGTPRPPRERKAPVPRAERKPTCSAREAIFRCLARREHSQKELRDRLRLQNHTPEAIEEALTSMAEEGYQSDTKYAQSMVRFKGARQGERRLRQTLAHQKIDKEVIDEALSQVASEVSRAVDTLRRFENKTPDQALRQKATRYLAARGFSFDTIKKAWQVVFEGKDLEEFEF